MNETFEQKVSRWWNSLTPELQRDTVDENGNPYVRFIGFQDELGQLQSDHPVLQPGYIAPAINSAGESIEVRT